MKTMTVNPDAAAVHALWRKRMQEDVLLRMDDGTGFYLSLIDDFDREVAQLG